jgi:iron complex outermembrane receptor protein
MIWKARSAFLVRNWSNPTALISVALIACPWLFQVASAQSADQGEYSQTATRSTLEEVVVTAERKQANLQQTPLSVSAINGDALRSQQQTNLESLSQNVPNLDIGRNAGDAHVFIRGVGYDQISPGGETRVALYTDGVYESRSQAAFMGFYDVDRVEVLRGPQGTLYGRNAVAGAINIITRDPTQTMDGYFSGTAGSYQLVGSEGAIGGPLTADLSGRVAFRTVDRQGYGVNIQTGEQVDDEHTRSVRAKLKYDLSSSLTIRLNWDLTNEKDHGGGYRYITSASYIVPPAVPLGQSLGFVSPMNPHDAAGFGPMFSLDTYGISAQIDWQLADASKLTSLTGYRHLTSSSDSTNDDSTADISKQYLNERSNQFSQELRLSQNIGSFADLLLGGYYFRENNFASNKVPIAGVAFGIPTLDLYQAYQALGSVLTKAYAGFAQVNFHLTDQAGLTIGGRYSHEEKSIDEGAQFDTTRLYDPRNPFIPNIGTRQQTESESSANPVFTFDYKFTKHLYGYATYSTGFKSGGFNIGGLQPPFKAEKITNHEIGIKADLLDQRLRVNVSAFYYNYKNLQVNITEGQNLVTRNAASSRIKGLEAELTAVPIEDLRVTLNASYLDAKYLDFTTSDPTRPYLGALDLAGNTLDYAPKYKLDGTVGYTFHAGIGSITPQLNVIWTDTVYFSQFNLPQVRQPSWTDVNAYVNYSRENSGWAVNGYVKNLTNKTYVVGDTVASSLFGYPVVGQAGPPRTYGVQITKTF